MLRIMVNETQAVELTGQSINPTLESEGNIFMGDAATGIRVENPGAEGHAAAPEKTSNGTPDFNGQAEDADSEETLRLIRKDEAVPEDVREAARRELERAKEVRSEAHKEDLRGQWQKAKAQAKEGAIDDASIEAAVEAGHGPDARTSKLLTNLTARQVIENANLDRESEMTPQQAKELLEKGSLTPKEEEEIFNAHKKRLEKAESLLKIGKLSPDQKKAILRAHYVGLGEPGKHGKAGVFNLSKDQIERRVVILEKAGFSKDQIRILIESGLSAAAPPAPIPAWITRYNAELNNLIGTIATPLGLAARPTPFTNARFEEIRQQLIEYNNQRNALMAVYFPAYVAAVAAGTPPPQLDPGALNREFLTNLGAVLEAYVASNAPSGTEYVEIRSAVRNASEYVGMLYHGGAVFIEQFEDLTRRGLLDERRGLVIRTVSGINPSRDVLSSDVLRRIIQDTDRPGSNGLDFLVNRIVGIPLADETGTYNLGFYGGINLETIDNLLNIDSDDENLPREIRRRRGAQLRETKGIQEAVRAVHELNKEIVAGRLENYQTVAALYLARFSQRFQKIKGVGVVQRLLEKGHAEILSRDGMINEHNYAELMGNKLNEKTGKLDEEQPNSVLEEFREMVERAKDPANAGLVTNDLEELRSMQEWEIKWAYNIGRNLFNIWHRAAEWISQGENPPGTEQWESFPQEGFARIFNFGQAMLRRFEVGKNRGGMRWFDLVMESMQRSRKDEEYGDMQLDMIKGSEMRLFELTNLTGVRGWWASWRAVGAIMRHVDSIYDPRGALRGVNVFHQESGQNRIQINRETNLGHLVDTNALEFEIGGIKYHWKEDPRKPHIKELPDNLKAEFLRSVFFEPGTGISGHPPVLRPDIQVGLGALLKISLGPEKGKGETSMVKEQIRALIWERVAKENPLAIAPYLHNLKYSANHRDPNLAGRTIEIMNDPSYVSFSRKMAFFNEIKLSMIRGFQEEDGSITPRTRAPILDFTLNDAIAHATAIDHSLTLTAEEQALRTRIATQGALASEDLANVRFGFIPFLNDVILENADYQEVGAEGYKRHVNDMASFNGSNSAALKIMDRPGEIIDYEQIVKAVREFEAGITAVHGDATGKEKAFWIIEAMVDFYIRGGNAGGEHGEYKGSLKEKIIRFLRQQDEVNELLKRRLLPNSIAQQYYNEEVLAMDRGQLIKLMKDLVSGGIMGHEEEKRYKKKYGGFLKMILEGILRGIKGGFIVSAAELLKRSFNPKGAVE